MEKTKGQILLPGVDEKVSYDIDKDEVKRFVNRLIDDPGYLQDFKKNPVDHLKKMGMELSPETAKKIQETMSKPFASLTEEDAKVGPGAAIVVVAVYTASDGPLH
ncbi:MAG: hypothetical protein ACOYXY_09605 [Thermodesulfobacteriota bacterium]